MATSSSSSSGPANALAAELQKLIITPRMSKQQANEIKTQRATLRKNAKDKKKDQENKWALETLRLPKYPPRNNIAEKTADVNANFFVVRNPVNVELHRYNINLDLINNKVPKKRELRRYLITTLLEDQVFKNKTIACDYFSQIVSVGKLWNHGDDAKTAPPVIEVKHARTARPNSDPPAPLLSKITYAGPLNMKDIAAHVDPKQRKADYLLDEHFKALNIISWKHINGPTFDGGRNGNKFYPNEDDLRSNLTRRNTKVFEARTGFFTSMRPGDGSLLINVNTCTTAFFPAWPLQQWITANWPSGVLPAEDRIKGILIGLRVTFAGDSPPHSKTRRIAEIGDKPASGLTFSKDEGTMKRTVTVYDHMVAQYGPGTTHRLRFSRDACCANLGGVEADQKRWYPADQLKILDWQVVPGKVDDDFTKDMLKAAKQTPNVNHNRILKFARAALGICGPGVPAELGDFLRPFGLEITPDLVKLKPRKLRQPSLTYGNAQLKTNIEVVTLSKNNRPASWNLEAVATRGYVNLGSPDKVLCIIRFDTTSSQGTNQEIAKTMKDTFIPEAGKYKLTWPGGVLVVEAISTSDRKSMTKALDQAYLKLVAGAPNGYMLKMLVVVLPQKDIKTYANVKWWGDCLKGIPTVVVTAATVKKLHDPTLLANVCLKMNFKLGGQNHEVTGDLGVKGGTMIVGADVSHSGRGDDPGCPSLAGIVASHADFPRTPRKGGYHNYLASARLQNNNTEYIEDLEGMMVERIQTFYLASGTYKILPSHILFYRDGVSESQLGMVYSAELAAIKRAIERVKNAVKADSWDPKVTLLVVTKRHHARFYQIPETQFNNPAGTVVDHTVVTPNQFSFYLQSHDSPIGTARCGHYIVIANESEYTMNELQEITNKLCFTGSRATTALSICTPARYADLLCERLRCYFKPVLDGRFLTTINNGSLDTYRQNTDVWGEKGRVGGNRKATATVNAPWGENLDGVMFYL